MVRYKIFYGLEKITIMGTLWQWQLAVHHNLFPLSSVVIGLWLGTWLPRQSYIFQALLAGCAHVINFPPTEGNLRQDSFTLSGTFPSHWLEPGFCNRTTQEVSGLLQAFLWSIWSKWWWEVYMHLNLSELYNYNLNTLFVHVLPQLKQWGEWCSILGKR
jgi:hypothetical protein